MTRLRTGYDARTALCAVAAAASAGAWTPAVEAAGRIVITEIMYNPASSERAGETEWVEIANVGDEAVEIRKWRLDDEDRGEWGPFSCRLEPGGAAVLVNAKAVDERAFREAWDAARPGGSGGDANEEGATAGADEDGETDERAGEGSIGGRATSGDGSDSASDPASPPQRIARPGRYLVLPVKWGRLSNRPSREDEILRLVSDRGETVCMVNYEAGGEWPTISPRGGMSIYLMDVRAADASIGRLWAASEPNRDGAWASRTAGAFDAMEVGSPGVLPGGAGPSEGAAAGKDGTGESAGKDGQRDAESDDTIDY